MKDLSVLHPYVKYLAEKLIEKSKKQGINIIITQTYRTIKEQNEIYAQGRTKVGAIISNAKGGSSFHNFRLAFDFAVLNVDGTTVNWSSSCDTDKDGQKDYYEVGAIGKSLGLTWGGTDFGNFVDLPHFQWTGGLTLKEVQAGKVPITSKDKGDDNVEHNTMKLFYSDGTPVKVDNYKIDGSTYVNLRDILSIGVKSIKVVQGDKIYLIKQ